MTLHFHWQASVFLIDLHLQEVTGFQGIHCTDVRKGKRLEPAKCPLTRDLLSKLWYLTQVCNFKRERKNWNHLQGMLLSEKSKIQNSAISDNTQDRAGREKRIH